jgi:hypothetical protein
MTDLEALTLAEDTLGTNLVWITDQADLGVRQKDPETLRRLKHLNDTWVALVRHLKSKELETSVSR